MGAWYDVAQICMNGHVANSATEAFPEEDKKFCDECGEPTITACPACKDRIRGVQSFPGLGKVQRLSRYSPPAHCIGCGKPYPWTERRLTAAKELAQEMEGLTAEERDLLSRSLDDLVRDTPQTPVAATRFKKVMAKVGTGAGRLLYDMVVDIASETTKKAMGL